MITVRSTINLAHQSVPEVIPAVQGDTGRSILFSLADFTIPTGATARYFITKPSGLAVYNDATIDGNTVLVDLTAQSLAEYGDCPGQVRIILGDDIVTSFEFILHVEPFRGIDAVESTTEMNIFDALVTSAVDEAREQIEDIAEEVIETIPDDYTALTENVADLNETIYDLAEAQGNPVIIYDGADNAPVKDLKITFSASSNVNRIQVVRSGKNLVVDKLANGAVDGDGKYTNNSKRITNSFTSTYPISRTWLKAGTYTLSIPGLAACTVVIKTDATTVAHAWTLEQTLPFTFTTQTDGYFIFSARNSANTDISPSDYHAQLEAGSKATDFEPARIKTVTTILYPLSISEGVLDFTTGQLTSGGSVYAVDAADISTVEGYNRIDAYMMSNSTAHMASTTSMDVIYRKNEYAWDKFLNVYPTENAQGNPASFDDGADGIPVKDLKVSIVPHQAGSGDPSPDNVRPITGMTEVEVENASTNKAKFGTVPSAQAANFSYQKNEANDIKCTKVTSSSAFFAVFEVDVKTAGTYRLATDSNTANISAYGYKDSLSGTGVFSNLTPNSTATLPVGKIVIGLYAGSAIASGTSLSVVNFRVNEGSSALPYEDYHYQEYTIPLGRTVYGGQPDITTGVLTVDMASVDLGSLTWGYSASSSMFTSTLPLSAHVAGNVRANALCETYQIYSRDGLNTATFGLAIDTYANVNYLSVKDATYTSADAFKTAMSGVQLVYELATPVTYQLTPQELLSVLGTNHISTDAESVDVEYRADIQLYIEQLTKPEEDDLIANQAIAAGTFFMIGNRLFLSTASIANGATITVGTNATELSLAEALNSLN